MRRRRGRTFAAGCALSALLAGCGGGDESVEGEDLPYSYTFPSDFKRADASSLTQLPGRYDDESVISKARGAELVSVQTETLSRPVSAKLLPRIEQELETRARRFGKVTARRKRKVDGLAAIEFTLDLDGGTGARWTFVPKDRKLYWVNCQWQRDRESVLKACARVNETLRLK